MLTLFEVGENLAEENFRAGKIQKRDLTPLRPSVLRVKVTESLAKHPTAGVRYHSAGENIVFRCSEFSSGLLIDSRGVGETI